MKKRLILINLIIEGENYENKLFNEVKKIVSENAEKNKLVKHLNIILAGPTGAGKSTLINKILNFIGEKAIKTGIGVPCTMGEPKYYESETVPLLRLADSRGIEKTNYRMKELINNYPAQNKCHNNLPLKQSQLKNDISKIRICLPNNLKKFFAVHGKCSSFLHPTIYVSKFSNHPINLI